MNGDILIKEKNFCLFVQIQIFFLSILIVQEEVINFARQGVFVGLDEENFAKKRKKKSLE